MVNPGLRTNERFRCPCERSSERPRHAHPGRISERPVDRGLAPWYTTLLISAEGPALFFRINNRAVADSAIAQTHTLG